VKRLKISAQHLKNLLNREEEKISVSAKSYIKPIVSLAKAIQEKKNKGRFEALTSFPLLTCLCFFNKAVH
jgi:hypothetical protein